MMYFYIILSRNNNEFLFKKTAIQKIRIVLIIYLIYSKYEFVGVHWDAVVPQNYDTPGSWYGRYREEKTQ